MKKSSGSVLIIIVVIVLLLATGAVWYFLGQKGGQSKPEMKRDAVYGKLIDFSKKYRDAGVVFPLEKSSYPSTVPTELIYPGATLVTLNQTGGAGVAYVSQTGDSSQTVMAKMTIELEKAGWKEIEKGEGFKVFAKGDQKAKIKLDPYNSNTIISVGLTF